MARKRLVTAVSKEVEEDDTPLFDEVEAPSVSEKNARLSALAAVAKEFKSFRPASEVLTRVKAVPTIFPQFDFETRVGGLPIERFSLLHGPSAGGKALAVDTPVLTPCGWKAIGDIRVGDEVIAVDGTPTRVEGVYPQGKRNLYEVSFNDGSSVECCAEHLWYTTTTVERMRGRYVRTPRPERKRIPTGVDGQGSVKSLAEIMKDFRPNFHAIPLAEAVDFKTVGHLPIDPYLLGILLGDGGMTQGQLRFFKPEKDMQRAFIERLPEGDEGVLLPDGSGVRVNGDGLKRELARLDLWGCRSWEKFIPDLYMRASKEDRLELLRGLLDTDGSVPKDRGAVEFSSTSFKLSKQVVELARSLGGFVAVADIRKTGFTYRGVKKQGRSSTRVRIVMPRDVVPVSSEKHLARWRPNLVRTRLRTIDNIQPSRRAEAVCIRVAHPRRLFVIKDYVVTHNTYWTIGLLLSFLMRDHFGVLIDAERTTPITWLQKAMGEYATHPGFFAERPKTYEKTVLAVRHFVNTVKKLRDDKRIPEHTSALIVVDSIRKLVPEDQFKRIMKAAKEAGDAPEKVKDRSAQIKAAMNAAWLDELIPLLEETQTAMVVIARETEDPDADAMARKYGKNYKVGGGKHLYYDASMNMRVSRIGSYGKKIKVNGKERLRPFGDRHKVDITKSKVSGKGEEFTATCEFHISNGVWTPAGFDRARDLIDIARRFDIIQGTSWLKYGKKKWQGEDLAVKKISEDKELFAKIESEVRKFIATKREESEVLGED